MRAVIVVVGLVPYLAALGQSPPRTGAESRPAGAPLQEDDEWGGMRQAASGHICALGLARHSVEDNVAEEKRYAGQVGVVNLGRLEILKQRLQAIDREVEKTRKQLEEVNRLVLPCDSSAGKGIVGKLARCVPARATMSDGEVLEWAAPGTRLECRDRDVVWMKRKFFPGY